jgi:hypothetical protein
MSSQTNKRNYKHIVIPIISSVILIGLLLIQQIQHTTALPSPDWSRSISISEDVEYSTNMTVENDNGTYTVYLPTEENINKLTMNSSLTVNNKEILNVSIPTKRPFWAYENMVIFERDETLYAYDGEKEKVLDQSIDGFRANENVIIYWKGKSIYSINKKTFETIFINENKSSILDIYLNANTSSFIVKSQAANSQFQLTLFKYGEENNFEEVPLLKMLDYIGNVRIKDFEFIEYGDKLTIIYQLYSSKGGSRSYTNYFSTIDITNIPAQVNFKQLLVYERNNPIPKKNARFINLSLKNQKLTLLFSAKGPIAPKKTQSNIYLATPENGKWIANRVSTTDHVSMNPFWLGNQTILWYDYVSSSQYQLFASSKDIEVINASKQMTKADFMTAIVDSTIALFVSFIVVLNSFIWLVPPILYFIILAFSKPRILEEDPSWISKIGITLYVITQVFVIQSLLDGMYLHLAPSYLTFKGSSIIVPLVIAFLSWLIMRFASKESWNGLQKSTYFIAVNILLISLLAGPYVL